MRRIICSSLEELVQATIILTKEGVTFKAYTDTLTISIEGY
ncbi:hypothetical protein HOR87_gp02 [Marinomonas phage CB5A]|uniref:Uncharacterized protein n=1 Tax=Marinomonas phage CB5A TaxID=2022859 RepID=A0A222G3C7_9CAUD|nr:hypothetical protein HOR87_gp02 [Marinomonas phage CB5A]ASP46261.1 hypothetical protein [Marinomonas phage CB5A]